VVEADHNIRLPGIPNTPAIQNFLSDGVLTWCVNASGANYPGFVAQIQEVNDAATQDLKGVVTHQQVPYVEGNAVACEVNHRMLSTEFCATCAANVRYANWPVVIQYKKRLGYTDWKSAVGHEMGHVYGLHEQYIDSGGAIGCGNPATDSLMDCGSPFHFRLQPFDIENLREWLPLASPQWGHCDFNWGGCWNHSVQRWIGPTGNIYNVFAGEWTIHRRETGWGGYWNNEIRRWVASDGSLYSGAWVLHPSVNWH